MSVAGLVQLYTADPAGAATPIMVDGQTPPLTAPVARVTLTVDVAQLCPPGWPSPPDETGVAATSLWFPRTLRSGTTITVFACAAAALIAADAATPA
jgi:hypothetical protein